jgi:hypothetical protein
MFNSSQDDKILHVVLSGAAVALLRRSATIRVKELAYEANSHRFEQSTNDASNVSRELPTGLLNVMWSSHLERSTHKSKTQEA